MSTGLSATRALPTPNRLESLLYDLMLLAYLGTVALAQFPSAYLGLARWVQMPLVALLSIYLIRDRKLGRNPVAVGIYLVAVYTMATAFISYYPTVSLLKSISLLMLAGFLLVVPVALQTLHPTHDAKEQMLRLYASFAVPVVLSNAVYYLLRPGSSNEYFSGTSFLLGRFRGWFVNPNDIAATYAIFLPILWHEMGLQKHVVVKTVLSITFSLAVIQLLATQSRAGVAAAVISILVLVLGSRKWGTRVIILALLAFLLLAVIAENPEVNAINRFIYRNDVNFTGSGRFPVWIATWNRFLDRLFLGSGLGVADTGSAGAGLAITTGTYTIEKGNSYLGALEELGLVGGTLLFITLMLPLLKRCWNGITGATEGSAAEKLNLVLISIVVAGLAHATFEAWLLSVGDFRAFSFWVFGSLLLYRGGEA